MHKFPSIEQFRNVIHQVRHKAYCVGKQENGEPIFDYDRKLPTLMFEGTVKLHGTNAGIVFNMETGEITYQSRERVLSLTSDNAGFMLWGMSQDNLWTHIFENIWVPVDTKKIAIYGEWCGSGIQKGVAISQLPKMFVIFSVAAFDSEEKRTWLDFSEDELFKFENSSIYSIHDFPSYYVEIDFNYPELAQNKMIEITEAVEAECPVGKALGVSGIGEGVVWTCITPGWISSRNWFKVKGEKHQTSKVKTLNPVDIEAVQNIKSFVDATVTEARLEWALHNMINEKLLPFEMKSLGDFIRICYNDVVKEEQDVIVASQIDPKKIGSAVANVARPWYINAFNRSVMNV